MVSHLCRGLCGKFLQKEIKMQHRRRLPCDSLPWNLAIRFADLPVPALARTN
jgi:hypothetical protein